MREFTWILFEKKHGNMVDMQNTSMLFPFTMIPYQISETQTAGKEIILYVKFWVIVSLLKTQDFWPSLPSLTGDDLVSTTKVSTKRAILETV
jgi:hypothetical protein